MYHHYSPGLLHSLYFSQANYQTKYNNLIIVSTKVIIFYLKYSSRISAKFDLVL